MYSKGLGHGLQTEVRIATSFLIFWELVENEQIVHTGTVKLHHRFLWLLWKKNDKYHKVIAFISTYHKSKIFQ